MTSRSENAVYLAQQERLSRCLRLLRDVVQDYDETCFCYVLGVRVDPPIVERIKEELLRD